MAIIHLDIPVDVKKYILKFQGDVKTTKGIGQYSQQQAIYQIIREHKKFNKKNKTQGEPSGV